MNLKKVNLIKSLFKDEDIWNHLCIIVTNNRFKNKVEKEIFTNGPDSYQEKLSKFIESNEHFKGKAPKIPFFFIDLYATTGKLTKDSLIEFKKLEYWAEGLRLKPIKTNNIDEIDYYYMKTDTISEDGDTIIGNLSILTSFNEKKMNETLCEKTTDTVNETIEVPNWDCFNGTIWKQLKCKFGLENTSKRIIVSRDIISYKCPDFTNSSFFKNPENRKYLYPKFVRHYIKIIKKTTIGWSYDAESLSRCHANTIKEDLEKIVIEVIIAQDGKTVIPQD